jgi:site-specific DNA recombinase
LTRSGKPAWDRTTVWGILKNPAYVGTAAFGKTRIGAMRERLRPVRGGAEQPRWPYSTYDVPEQEWLRMPVPALIESDLFAVAQEQLAENRQRNRQTRRGQRYLLQGLLVCRRCGYAYYGKAISLRAAKGKQRDYAYYRCCGSDAHRFGGQRLCANPQLRTDRADATVWQEVQRLLQNPDMIAAEYERRLHRAQHPDANRPDLITAEAQIAKLRRGIARLIDGYTEGLIEKPNSSSGSPVCDNGSRPGSSRPLPCKMRRLYAEPCLSSSVGSKTSQNRSGSAWTLRIGRCSAT